MMPASAVTLHDLTLGYDGHPAVHHLNGSFARGSLTAIVGPNGAGKSTLLKGMMGTIVPLGGYIEHHGAPAHDIAYLPQIADIDRSFPATVNDLVALGLWKRRGLFRGISTRDRTDIANALQAVGLSGFEHGQIDTLSGGQLQRCLFARVLLQDAQIILLDEPFTAIDQKTTTDLIDVILRWHAESRTVVAVLHDTGLVHETFPQTLLINREPIAWGATETALKAENMLRARRMTEAFDDNVPWHDNSDLREGRR